MNNNNIVESAREGTVFSVEELLLNRGVVVEDVPVSELDLNDKTFSTHDDSDDVSALEESLRADGQVDPIIVRRHDNRWQVVDGFRRVRAALHLGWNKVKARRFDALTPTQAALWAVKNITMTLPHPDALEALAGRLDQAGEHEAGMLVRRYAEAIEVVQDEPAAVEGVEEPAAQDGTDQEVTLDQLAEQTLNAFTSESENVQLLQENWTDVPEETREALRAHFRYYADLLQFLEEAPAEAQEEQAEEPPPDDDPTTA